MEKVKLSSGEELNLIVCGILVDEANEKMTLRIVPDEEDTLDDLYTLLADPDKTATIKLLSESGETLGIYPGYTKLQSITMQMDGVIGYTQDESQTPITGRLVTAVLVKPDATERRLTSLEETVDMLVMDSLGLE